MLEQPRNLKTKPKDPRVAEIIKLAVMAVGGQGGGVLTGWIETCARLNGYAVQATSVAGVAQRTGATIYYIEMSPEGEKAPVFSLMPAAGDVDILVAAEMMEAGRAIMRGFVTPDRTTLIASSHRALAVSEKTVPGDGISDSEQVVEVAKLAAKRLLLFDMQDMAVREGSVISASLFGALAGSGTLPFARESFEEAIRSSGRGVEASLRAFANGFEAADQGRQEAPQRKQAGKAATVPKGPDKLVREWNALAETAQAFPEPVAEMALPGLRHVVDFQDLAYGRDYLDRLAQCVAADREDKGFAFSTQAAKYIAKAMAYDDVQRVADIKTRASRFDRVRAEIAPPDGTRMMVTEYFHPRAQEIVGMLPRRLGARIENSPRAMRFVDRMFNRGRRLRTDRLFSFLTIYLLGGLRRWRRGTLRHAQEREHLEKWLSDATAFLKEDYDLAVEILCNRRLIKGYSDTHARGTSKYARVMEGVALVAGRDDAADWVRRLREAALADENGDALDGALKTVRSFTVEKEPVN